MPLLFENVPGLGFSAEQSADARLDYGLDWSAFLAASGNDAIATSVWESVSPDLLATDATVVGSIAYVFLSGGEPGRWHAVKNSITTHGGRRESQVCHLFIRAESGAAGHALFPDRTAAIMALRRDYLPLLLNNYDLPPLTDEFLWGRLAAAEAHIERALRVPLRPTEFFPYPPSQAELDAIGDTPWAIDEPYDIDPHDVQFGGIRFIRLRSRSVIAVHSVDVVYPGQQQPMFRVPPEWLRLEHRPGHLQIIAVGGHYALPAAAGGIGLPVFHSAMVVPHVLHIRYRAGLTNIARDYPDLLDAAQRLAGIGALRMAALPQSGSISADGLSQSTSAPDLDTMQGQIDASLADISAAIVGIRTVVL